MGNRGDYFGSLPRELDRTLLICSIRGNAIAHPCGIVEEMCSAV